MPADVDIRNDNSGKLGPHIDVRGTGGFAVCPPSVHASGTPYRFVDPDVPIADSPEWVIERLSGKTKTRVPAALATGTAITKGSRTNRLASLAGTLHKRDMAVAAIEAALLAENKATCDPPLPEEKVRAIAHDIPARYPNAADAPQGDGLKLLRRPDLICLANVALRAVDYLWKPYLPKRMLAMLSGDPGAGKTFISLAIAADLTIGRTPSGERCEPIAVLYLSNENAPAEVVRPRFDSLGGDPARLYLLRGSVWSEKGEDQQGAVSLSDVSLLDAALRETNAKLVVVDPLQSYFGGADLHRSNETRPVMDGLAKLAESHECAILLVRHLSKQTGGRAIHRGLGSIDLTGAVRSELLAGSLPDDPTARALVHIKSNIGAIGASLGYVIDGEGRFAWTGRSEITADQMLEGPSAPRDRSAADEAREWLKDFLSEGSREQHECRSKAEAVGISYGTLRRAKDALRVRSYKATMRGPWLWGLPQGVHGKDQGEHTDKVSTFGEMSTFEDAQSSPRCSTLSLLTPLDSQGAQKFSVSTPDEHVGDSAIPPLVEPHSLTGRRLSL